MPGINVFAAERQRQIEAEGYSPEHDAEHGYSDLVKAGQCYAAVALLIDQDEYYDPTSELWFSRDEIVEEIRAEQWPWEPTSFKPADTAKRNLEKAGALLAAAYDALEAAHETPK